MRILSAPVFRGLMREGVYGSHGKSIKAPPSERAETDMPSLKSQNQPSTLNHFRSTTSPRSLAVLRQSYLTLNKLKVNKGDINGTKHFI